jgi:GNAT superfamily N-acetyltransferase
MSTKPAIALLIRDARPGDATRISELAMRSKAHWGYTADFMEQCRGELEIDSARLVEADFVYRVVELANTMVGFHAIHILSPGKYELEGLFVEPGHIGCGVGRCLIEDALQLIGNKGGGELLIQGDPHAERFYLAAGARQIGTRESGSVAGRHLPLFQIDISP